VRITRDWEPYAPFSCFANSVWVRLPGADTVRVSYISKAGILTVTPSRYIMIFSLWRCICIVIKSPHNVFKDKLNHFNSLRMYQYRRAHTFSWHNYTSKIKCQAPAELPTRALLFWSGNRFSFPFLGRSPSAPSCLREDLEVGEEHLSLCNIFTPTATCKSEVPWVHDPLGCGTWAFTRANKISRHSSALPILLGKPSSPSPAETQLGLHSPWDSWIEWVSHLYRIAISNSKLKDKVTSEFCLGFFL